MVGTRGHEEVSLESIHRRGRELREKARSTRQVAPQLSGRSGATTPARPVRRVHNTPYGPSERPRPSQESNSGKVDDAAGIEEIQHKGRQIRELLRINATPRSANQSRTSTPVRGMQARCELSLRTALAPSSYLACSSADVDKWPNQASSRSLDEASTTAPSQTSARSLRSAPSSSRSLRASTVASPPVSGRPPRMPGSSPKLKVEGPCLSPGGANLGEKAAYRQPCSIEPVPSRVLFLPERLAEAARCGDVELTNECISELPDGAPVCVKDKYGWTSLHYAAQGGHFEVCRLLLEARGDANAELPDFSTPIMLAVEEGDIPVAELLLQHGARIRSKDEAGFTVMDRCAPGALHEFTNCVQQYMAVGV